MAFPELSPHKVAIGPITTTNANQLNLAMSRYERAAEIKKVILVNDANVAVNLITVTLNKGPNTGSLTTVATKAKATAIVAKVPQSLTVSEGTMAAGDLLFLDFIVDTANAASLLTRSFLDIEYVDGLGA